MSKRMRRSKLDIEIDYEEEPDWESLSVLPMRQTSHKKYCSSVWEYFGQLMRSTTCLDNKNFYCLPCFELHKLKQYSATTATSNFYTHLRAFHNILPERITKGSKSKLSNNAINATAPTNISHIVQQNDETNELNDFINDPLSEMLVVRPSKKLKESQIDDNDTQLPFKVKQTKFVIKKERQIQPKPPLPQQQQQQQLQQQRNFENIPSTSMRIDEAISTEDYDKLFILSLVKEFRNVRDDYRLDAKADLLGVLRKYQHLSRGQPQNYNFTTATTEQRLDNVSTEYETQNEY